MSLSQTVTHQSHLHNAITITMLYGTIWCYIVYSIYTNLKNNVWPLGQANSSIIQTGSLVYIR